MQPVLLSRQRLWRCGAGDLVQASRQSYSSANGKLGQKSLEGQAEESRALRWPKWRWWFSCRHREKGCRAADVCRGGCLSPRCVPGLPWQDGLWLSRSAAAQRDTREMVSGQWLCERTNQQPQMWLCALKTRTASLPCHCLQSFGDQNRCKAPSSGAALLCWDLPTMPAWQSQEESSGREREAKAWSC